MATLLNGQAIPGLIYGTTVKPSNPEGEDLLFHALASGFRAFDTASTRKFHREDLDGKQLTRALLFTTENDSAAINTTSKITRDEILVQSKFTPSHGHIDPKPFSNNDDLFTQVLKSLERSLNELGVDIIDVYLLHCLLPTFAETMAVWTAMEIAVKVGKVRYIGICNVDGAILRRLYEKAQIKPSFVQNRYKRENAFDVDVRRFCAETGIVYEIFGVLGARNSDLLQLAPVKLLAEQNQCSPEEALLQIVWASGHSQGLQICILTGTSKPVRMRRNIELVNLANLGSITRDVLMNYEKALAGICIELA